MLTFSHTVGNCFVFNCSAVHQHGESITRSKWLANGQLIGGAVLGLVCSALSYWALIAAGQMGGDVASP